MRFARPDRQLMRNAFGVESAAQSAIAVMKRIMLPDRERDLHPPQGFEEMILVQAGYEMLGRNEVNVLIVVAVEQILKWPELARKVVPSAQRHHLAE